MTESKTIGAWLTSLRPFKSLNPKLTGFLIFITVSLFFGFLSWLDDTTELWPRHTTSIAACFLLAGFVALAVATTAVLRSSKLTAWQRIRITLVVTLLSFIGVTLFSLRMADIIHGWIDFPAQKTQTFQSLLQISRADGTPGTNSSDHIQTTPIWSHMKITHDDYVFMQTNRWPGDAAKDPYEISSKGYFCAKVTMQRSGDALRVLHAGGRTLPSGTVIICPQIQAPDPH